MKKGLIISLAAAVIGLAAISCTKEDPTLRYGNATMGNIVNGKFTSDQGNIFNVTEQTCQGKLDTMSRAFVVCDVLKQTGTAENEYDVRVNFISKVLTKNAVALSEVEDPAILKKDPIILVDSWVSGGYLNLLIKAPFKKTGGKSHFINLTHEYKDGVYNFSIGHDAEGEVLKEEGDNSGLVFANAYVSFPISTVIKEDTAKFTLSWNSYIYNDVMVSAKTTELKANGEYKKSAFEQVPPTATVPTATFSIR